MKLFIVFSTYFLLIGCTNISEEKETDANIPTSQSISVKPIFHGSHEPKKTNAPFSDAVQVGNTFYLAGQIGMDHSVRALVTGGIEAETKQALENIKAVLKHHDMKLSDVVKATVILQDIDDFSAFNAVYSAYLPQKPARTTFAAKALARGAKIEIEVIAVRNID